MGPVRKTEAPKGNVKKINKDQAFQLSEVKMKEMQEKRSLKGSFASASKPNSSSLIEENKLSGPIT